jgi:hypothetical protein|tara:strand:- start:609 stop:905 length:297 start_codon:yes stop_codon:yes gene_type:complete
MMDVNNIIPFTHPTLGMMEMVVVEVHSLRQIVIVYVHLGIVMILGVHHKQVPEELLPLTIIVQVLVRLGIVNLMVVYLRMELEELLPLTMNVPQEQEL